MKKFSKVLAIALVVLMLMMTNITAFADYATMPLNEDVELYQDGGDYCTYEFIPRQEGWYVVKTYTYDDTTDPYIKVYDETFYELSSGDDSIFSSLNGEAWFFAERGETYYIEMGNYNSDDVEYIVHLEKENDSSHFYCWDNDSNGYCDWCNWQYCDHNCHKGGIAGFFWSIANLFNMLFGLNEYCECGEVHW